MFTIFFISPPAIRQATLHYFSAREKSQESENFFGKTLVVNIHSSLAPHINKPFPPPKDSFTTAEKEPQETA